MPLAETSHPKFSAEPWIAAVLCGSKPSSQAHSDTQYQQIAKTASDHGVAPLLHHRLSQNLTNSDYPQPLRKLLSSDTHQKAAWDLMREQDLGRVLDQLAAEGIPCLLIKGGGLAYTHYQHSYLRVRCDTDLLFPDRKVFEKAWQILRSIGFSRRNSLDGEFVGYQHSCWRAGKNSFIQSLDCHIKLNDYIFFAEAFDFDELMAHSVSITRLADSARTLGAVHALLLACMHRVATIPHGDADRLVRLFDMYLLCRSFDQGRWAEFLALARDRKLCGSCEHSFRAAMRCFPLPIPAEVMKALIDAAQNETFKPDMEMKRWQYYLQAFRMVPGWHKKVRLLREHFLPPADYVLQKYQTTNRFALPFLYVHRVLAGMKRYF